MPRLMTLGSTLWAMPPRGPTPTRPRPACNVPGCTGSRATRSPGPTTASCCVTPRWSETQWSEARGWYTAADFGFEVVVSHAVLFTRAKFDVDEAGINRATLETRMLTTIRHLAASNLLTGGTECGEKLFLDTTFQLYFVLAASFCQAVMRHPGRLWDQLDETTRAHVETKDEEMAPCRP